MSSSQQFPTIRAYSDEAATYEREGLPIPAHIRVKKLQAYHDWVAEGGLEKFAAAHNVEPHFMDRASRVEPAIFIAFLKKLATIPGLEAEMAPTLRFQLPWTTHCPGQQLIDDWENGLSSEEEAEEEAEDEEEKRRETENKGIEDEEEKKIKVFGLDKESKDHDIEDDPYILLADRACYSSPFRFHNTWSSPMKQNLASADSSPTKRHKRAQLWSAEPDLLEPRSRTDASR